MLSGRGRALCGDLDFNKMNCLIAITISTEVGCTNIATEWPTPTQPFGVRKECIVQTFQ